MSLQGKAQTSMGFALTVELTGLYSHHVRKYEAHLDTVVEILS